MSTIHSCQALIATCIDYRLQEYIDKWIDKKFIPKTFDRMAFAGGVLNLDTVLKQIGIAVKLHHIKKVVLINHEDCGAYGKAGTPQKHEEDLKKAEGKIKKLFPSLEVNLYYLHLDGTFEPLNPVLNINHSRYPHISLPSFGRFFKRPLL